MAADFPNTLKFLGALVKSDDREEHLFSMLLSNLTLDGYHLEANLINDFTSRRLQTVDPTSSDFFMNIALILMCVLFAGFASGLTQVCTEYLIFLFLLFTSSVGWYFTQGLLSLDFMEMEIKSRSGTPKEKEYAKRIIPIITNHHLLLVSLMLWNASATEALPIFLDKIVPEYVAIIISVTLVLMFGEIIPASILTGPKQLQIAANLVPLVYVVLFVFFPIAWPISKLLDLIIGHDSDITMYNRKEIATLMWLQHEEGVRRQQHHSNTEQTHNKKKKKKTDEDGSSNSIRDTMHHEEVTIIGGALKFRDMKVNDVMTHEKNIFMLSVKDTLSFKVLTHLSNLSTSSLYSIVYI